MVLTTRRQFVQQRALAGAALCGHPIKMLPGARQIFEAPEQNAAPLDATAVRKLVSLLNNGKVLMAGGASTTVDLATAELFDPTAGSFSPTGSLQSTRVSHTATLQ